MITHISLSIGSKKFLHLNAFTHIWVVRSLLQFSKCLDICCSAQQDVWISIVNSALPMSNFFRSWQNCLHNYNRPLLVLFSQYVFHTSGPVILIGLCYLVIVAVVSNWSLLVGVFNFRIWWADIQVDAPDGVIILHQPPLFCIQRYIARNIE